MLYDNFKQVLNRMRVERVFVVAGEENNLSEVMGFWQ